MTETVTVIKKEPTCAELVDEQWKDRQEDLKDPEYEALAFDYVEPHTFNDQPEGTGVGSSAGAGRATSCADTLTSMANYIA